MRWTAGQDRVGRANGDNRGLAAPLVTVNEPKSEELDYDLRDTIMGAVDTTVAYDCGPGLRPVGVWHRFSTGGAGMCGTWSPVRGPPAEGSPHLIVKDQVGWSLGKGDRHLGCASEPVPFSDRTAPARIGRNSQQA